MSTSSRRKAAGPGSLFEGSLSSTIKRGDSNESEESVGDMPIELRYLESDFFMDTFMVPEGVSVNVPVLNENEKIEDYKKDTNTANIRSRKFVNGKDVESPFHSSQDLPKSKSLDDLINAIMSEKKKNIKKIDTGLRAAVGSNIPRLSETGRANTYEDQTISFDNEDNVFMKEQAEHYYNHQLFLLLRHRHRHFSTSSHQSSRPQSTSNNSSKIIITPGSTFDCEDLMTEEKSNISHHHEENEEQCDTTSGNRAVSGSRSSILKGLRTFSASMKSIDISLRSTSVSSISSGKSLFSNFSAKSDSGIGLPIRHGKSQPHDRSRHKSTSPSSSRKNKMSSDASGVNASVAKNPIEQASGVEKEKINTIKIQLKNKKEGKTRSWESEPHLNKIDASQQKLSCLLKLKQGGSADEGSVCSAGNDPIISKGFASGTLQKIEQAPATTS